MGSEDQFEAFSMSARVFAIVGRIPKGRVTTYGDIARAAGSPRGARMVGWAIRNPPEHLDLPCHRVVNRDGFLSGGWHFGHPDIMRDRLLAERVPFRGEYTVDLAACRWIPDDEASTSADEMDDFDLVTG